MGLRVINLIVLRTRGVNFEVAFCELWGDVVLENTGNYHNLTRQRGIRDYDSRTEETLSLTDVSGCEYFMLGMQSNGFIYYHAWPRGLAVFDATFAKTWNPGRIRSTHWRAGRLETDL